jgi:hypothetical protein
MLFSTRENRVVMTGLNQASNDVLSGSRKDAGVTPGHDDVGGGGDAGVFW